MRLGRACTLQNDANGVGFFEKAIDLIRDEQYPLLLGAVYQAYAALRTQLGDLDAAKSLLSGALAIFTELGAEERAGEAEALLRALPG